MADLLSTREESIFNQVKALVILPATHASRTRSIKTGAAMFRFESAENACAGSTEIKNAVEKWKKWFKWLEFLAGLTSFIGLVAILFLWMVRGVDISSVPADRLQMETWWKVD